MAQSVHCNPPVAGYVEPEPDYDMSIHSNPDASDWAKFFMECKERNEWTLEQIDEGLMISWFANAMMAMHDYVERKHEQSTARGKFKMPVLVDDAIVEVAIGRE